MKWEESLKTEGENLCRVVRGVRSLFDDSLATKPENPSISCRIAVKISSRQMDFDNDASDRGVFQDTKGKMFGTHGLISFGEQGKSNKLKSRIDLFSHSGCAIRQSDLGRYPLKFTSFIYEMKATIPSIYLIEENPVKRGFSQSGLFPSCGICVVGGLISSAV